MLGSAELPHNASVLALPQPLTCHVFQNKLVFERPLFGITVEFVLRYRRRTMRGRDVVDVAGGLGMVGRKRSWLRQCGISEIAP